MDVLASIIIATLAISSISLIGGSFLILKRLALEKMSTYFVSFAAGVMLTTAFLDLLPESLEKRTGDDIFLYGLLGVVTFFFLERFVLWFHHHDETNTKPAAYLILLGDSLHNFFDGLAIAAAFVSNPSLGLITAMAIASHEIPQEIADFSILVHGGMSKAKALLFNFFSALTALVGAVLGFFFLSAFEKITPMLLLFSAGVFIYIACSDLIPDLHQHFKKQKKWATTVPFVIGIFVTYLLITFIHH